MIVHKWHNWLGQAKYDRQWHENDMTDELQELREAQGIVNTWSEMSDVVYTVSRGRWSGHDIAYPLNRLQIVAGHIYMFPKYTSRVLFFRRAGRRAGSLTIVQSVRNPRKSHKLAEIAIKNGIDPVKFNEVCSRQLRYWPLFP